MGDTVETDVEPPKWQHRAGDEYLPLCYYPQGNPTAGYRSEIVWRGDRYATNAGAFRQGLRDTGADDFNIAVIRGGRVVGWLWDEEIVDDDPEFLDRMTAELGLS